MGGRTFDVAIKKMSAEVLSFHLFKENDFEFNCDEVTERNGPILKVNEKYSAKG